jgi:hypothetical protein
MSGRRIHRGTADVGHISIDSFGRIDMSAGRPAGWSDLIQRLRFAAENLRAIAKQRWSQIHPATVVPAPPQPVSAAPDSKIEGFLDSLFTAPNPFSIIDGDGPFLDMFRQEAAEMTWMQPPDE